jgi:hypothetical protein
MQYCSILLSTTTSTLSLMHHCCTSDTLSISSSVSD